MFISMSTLADYEMVGNRSYGNEMFQYAALRIYALKNGLEVEIPKNWIGRELFAGCDDPVISTKKREQKDFGISTECIWKNGQVLTDHNIKGYFQYHTSQYAEYKDFFRNLFAPRERIRKKPDEMLSAIKSPLICLHIRRGDYGRPPNRVAPNEWYLKWLEENWGNYDNPILYIASDDLETIIGDFEKYKPVMCKPNTEAMMMFMDHYVMQHSNVLLASNSTFSFTAAMLNEKGGEFYRPDYQKKTLVPFDPWDSDPISPFPHHIKSAVRLHLGCGIQRLPGYINIDCMKTPATDLVCDIRKLPYEDNSVDTVESYHVFEHIPVCLHANVDSVYGEKYESLIATLSEWRRVLKPDGNLVIEMPDLEGIIKEYLEADGARKDELLIGIYGSYRSADDTDIHRWGADEALLRRLLEQAGFKYIKFYKVTDYHKDLCPCLRVEAVK